MNNCLKNTPGFLTALYNVCPVTYEYFPCRISKRRTDCLLGCTTMEHMSKSFFLNMTSDAKVRKIVEEIKSLSEKTTADVPDIDWFDQQFDPTDGGPLLPFSAYVITGTAGAGKSTSIAALHQNLNCLITGATVVAAQNLSKSLKSFCPTIYSAFGFKSKHINLTNRHHMASKCQTTDINQIQYVLLSEYWPVINSIKEEFVKRKKRACYEYLNSGTVHLWTTLGMPQLWTTNIIVIDEAGTLSSNILMAVVFFYWFYNGWLRTPLYKKGKLPCIVCVGSPTQTDAYRSLFNHEKQKNVISECDNILSFLIGNKVVADYTNISTHWALFINNKRCTDPEFGHLLKVLEYGLMLSDDIIAYVNLFVVPQTQILNPMEFIGWTRLFLSHAEVKNYISSLHNALSLTTDNSECMLFTCPIVCEVFNTALEEYKNAINLPQMTAIEWMTKNLYRLSNYSQFVDQDMIAVSTEISEKSTKVTYVTKFVKNSYVSVNGKTKKCICGFMGTYESFKRVLDNETFLDHYANEQPQHVYYFLSVLLYNSMYSFYNYGIDTGNFDYLYKLNEIPIAQSLLHCEIDVENLNGIDPEQDIFYLKTLPPPNVNSTSLATLIMIYNSLRDIFNSRLQIAIDFFGKDFLQRGCSTFTCNMILRNNIDYVCMDKIMGLLDYASTIESYQLKGYTFAPIYFGRPFQSSNMSQDLREKMPTMLVQDSMGFIACLENNISKMSETIEGGNPIHLCSVGDYGISSKLAMTITKAQGLSLDKVAICFGSHRKIKRSHVYVALSRARDPRFIVIDKNPLVDPECEQDICTSTKYIVEALHNPRTLLVY
ncbi:helicase [Porcine lymphotropic herpesvirus 3]|uniref:Helicase n=1 Tax=Suid gammaherpesvirus 5 TaxID=1960251 RepID=Q8B3X8_9GAMA|nr:helicase [Porcine lymphotropic herpesvirus 3]AAO12347.1 helicase [Porcine lymphotropic herpesvirus 3]